MPLEATAITAATKEHRLNEPAPYEKRGQHKASNVLTENHELKQQQQQLQHLTSVNTDELTNQHLSNVNGGEAKQKQRQKHTTEAKRRKRTQQQSRTIKEEEERKNNHTAARLIFEMTLFCFYLIQFFFS